MFGDQPEVLPAPSQVYGPTRPDLLKQPLEYEPRAEPGFSSLVAEVRRGLALAERAAHVLLGGSLFWDTWARG